MLRHWFVLARILGLAALAGGLLFAQQPAATEQKGASAQKAGAEQKPAAEQKAAVEQEGAQKEEAKPQEQAPSVAAPAQEKTVTGNVEFGYRWVPALAGNERVYRSIVNLGEGPKLFGADLSFRSPRPALFERLDLQATSWGGEPYNTARLNVGRQGIYALDLQYRRLDYFNILPSFANPLLDLGSELSQNGRDFQRRMLDVQLDVFPSRRFSPFFAYSRTAGTGPGLTTFVGPGNEYLVNTRFDDAVDLVRGGTHLNFSWLKLTLEGGGTRFRDDQRVFYDAGPNPGNRRTPLLGQTMRLDRAEQNYRAEGSTFFTRLSFQLQARSRADLSGQFSFTQPSLDFAFAQSSAGNFVNAQALRNFTAENSRSLSEALRPHPSGNLTLELRPVSRVRIVQSWYTDRFHISSSALFSQTLTGVTGLQGSTPPPTVELSESAFGILTTEYNRHQIEAIVEAHPKVTMRGGHRLVWADALVPARILSQDGAAGRARQRHQVGLGGVEFRPRKDLNLHFEAEASSGDSTFFRTGLLDYQKIKIRGRYRPRPWLAVNGMFTFFQNSNDRPDIDSRFRSHESSFSVLFSPREGRRITLAVDYMHSVLDSDLLIILTPFFDRGRSLYAQDAHYAGVFCNLGLVRGTRLNFGGTLLVSHGTRPTHFYQPRAELFVPLQSRVGWTSEWRWYGFSEERYRFENFNAHLFSVGLRLTL